MVYPFRLYHFPPNSAALASAILLLTQFMGTKKAIISLTWLSLTTPPMPAFPLFLLKLQSMLTLAVPNIGGSHVSWILFCDELNLFIFSRNEGQSSWAMSLGINLEIVAFNVQMFCCCMVLSWNFFWFSYLYAFFCFQISKQMSMATIWRICLLTLLLAFVSQHLLKVEIAGFCWCFIPSEFLIEFQMKFVASLLLKTCWVVSTCTEIQQEHLEMILEPNLPITSSKGHVF